MEANALEPRRARIERTTRETSIICEIALDGDLGPGVIDTGIGFFDHMLTLFAHHSGMELRMEVEGDLGVDDHHTVEDVGIVLGSALHEALGAKHHIARYGHAYVPMDEALCRAVVDLSGRFYLKFDAQFDRETVGTLATEMISHFWYSFAEHVRCNLHLSLLSGSNDHHRAESIFKAAARALRMAVHRDLTYQRIPSTKGTL